MKGTRGISRVKGASAGTAPVPSVERKEREEKRDPMETSNRKRTYTCDSGSSSLSGCVMEHVFRRCCIDVSCLVGRESGRPQNMQATMHVHLLRTDA